VEATAPFAPAIRINSGAPPTGENVGISVGLSEISGE